MKREKALLKNTMIYAIGNFLSKFLGFILLPVYTNYLTTSDYGYFDLSITTLTLVSPLVTYQITDALLRYLLVSKSGNEEVKIITNSLSIIIRNLLIANVIYLIITFYIDIKYGSILMVFLNLSVLSGFWSQAARGLKKNSEYTTSGIISTVTMLISNIILIVIYRLGVEGLIISNIISSLSVLIYVEFKLKLIKYIHIDGLDKSIKNKLVQYSIPFIPNAISWWVMNVSDRYILNYFLGINAIGIYAVANKFPSILVMINSIFNLSWQESAITEYDSEDKDKYYTKMFGMFMTFQLSAIIVLLMLTKYVIRFSMGINFQDSWKYVPFLYLGAAFSSFSSFYGVGYQVSEETKGAFHTTVIAAISNIIINIMLVRYLEIQAAALSTMVSYLLTWIIRVFHTRKYFTISIDKKRLYSLVLIIIIYLIFYYLDYLYIDVLLIVVSFIIMYLYNRYIVDGIIKRVLSRAS